MKIKLFYDSEYNSSSVSKIQEDVNSFIKDKDVVNIELTSEGAVNGHSYMIMVVYK